MNRFLLTGISLVGLSGVATAADMPLKAPPPPPVAAWSWTGFYPVSYTHLTLPTN